MKSNIVILFLLICLLSGNGFSSENPGHLVIVGGGLKPETRAVYEKFLNLAQGVRNRKRDNIRIGIIPAGSGYPADSAKWFKKTLLRYRVKEANVIILPIALNDDPTTGTVDESKWRHNVDKTAVAAEIKTLDALWFVGGDQSNYTKVLYDKGGGPTDALLAIFKAHKGGMVIGGTSAGAAIMSSPMIAGGTSAGALKPGIRHTFDKKHEDALVIKQGLGFFPYGIIDQHFNQRGRLGRLTVAAVKSSKRLHIGIDENTALVVDLREDKAQVVGAAPVTVIDSKYAEYKRTGKNIKISNVYVSRLNHGDEIDLQTGSFHLAKKNSKSEILKDPDDKKNVYVTTSSSFNCWLECRNFTSLTIRDFENNVFLIFEKTDKTVLPCFGKTGSFTNLKIEFEFKP